jgi:hypothetical protein
MMARNPVEVTPAVSTFTEFGNCHSATRRASAGKDDTPVNFFETI